MKITKINNRIYFNDNECAFANITLHEKEHLAYFELIKVKKEFRHQGKASILFEKVLLYVKENGFKIIELNPFPLERGALNIDELIEFYTKHGFMKSPKMDRAKPYLMCKQLV